MGGVVAACRNGIARAALAYNPLKVDAFGAGQLQKLKDGGHVARLMVRIVYDTEGGNEIREATVNCQLSAEGTVVAIS